jgi:ribosomal protein S18 acetylase RimI-like enzyme
MTTDQGPPGKGDAVSTSVEALHAFSGTDLADLCDATEAAILDGGGFGWLKPPPRSILEAYWKGVLLVPERHLFVARLDGIVAGSAQLTRPPRNNEAQAFNAHLTSLFMAPWARGYKLGARLVHAVEEAAREGGVEVLNIDIRDTQKVALHLYESLGYIRWGTHPAYARVNGEAVPGHYFYKLLSQR